MTPAEYVGIAIALLGMLGGGLGYWIRLELLPLAKLDQILVRLDEIEDDEDKHRQAGITWARAVHRHLVEHGHKSPPNPDHYPGL